MLYVSPVSVPPSEVRQILDQGAGQHVRQAADGGQPVQHLDDLRIRRCPATGTGIFWGPSGRSQVGVIVERGSRFVQLVALPDRAKTVMASAGNLLVEVLRLGLEQLMEAELLSRPPDVRRSGSSVETCTCIGCPFGLRNRSCPCAARRARPRSRLWGPVLCAEIDQSGLKDGSILRSPPQNR